MEDINVLGVATEVAKYAMLGCYNSYDRYGYDACDGTPCTYHYNCAGGCCGNDDICGTSYYCNDDDDNDNDLAWLWWTLSCLGLICCIMCIVMRVKCYRNQQRMRAAALAGSHH